MGINRIAIAAAVLAAAPAMFAQDSAVQPQQQTLPATTPLAITVSAVPAKHGEFPQFVTITLTNTSDGVVKLPMPSIGCANPMAGSVTLIVTPVKVNAEPCSIADAGLKPSKDWTTLQPGETANFGQRITPMLPAGADSVEVRGVYAPPVFGADTQEKLYRDSVTYEKDQLKSEPMTLARAGQ